MDFNSFFWTAAITCHFLIELDLKSTTSTTDLVICVTQTGENIAKSSEFPEY